MCSDVFLKAIHEKRLIQVKFQAKGNGEIKIRKCIPFDFAPSSRDKEAVEKYQLYDLNSPNGRHNLALKPNQILSILILEETFNPADYITWDEINWTIQRNWGIYS